MSLPTADLQPFARGSTEGEALWVIGGLYTFKALNAETGAYLACEVKALDGFAIPFHYHDDEEEGFYVAQGEATIFLGDDERRLGAGGFALAPRGLRHAFRLETPDTTLLLLLSPGPKHEALFREMGEHAGEPVVPPPPATPPDPALLGAIAASHGTHIVGPPPTR
jgi:quercetin dioxygenase-like cupin family protein